jgi:hypothetical protein
LRPSSVIRLAEYLDNLISCMAEHCKEYGTTPNVAPLRITYFSSRRGQGWALQNKLLNRVPGSGRSKFLRKSRALKRLVADLSLDFHKGSLTLAYLCTSDSVASAWSQLDAAHFDINTCFRETLVMLKCFLRALTLENLATFHEILSSPSNSARAKLPSTYLTFGALA